MNSAITTSCPIDGLFLVNLVIRKNNKSSNPAARKKVRQLLLESVELTIVCAYNAYTNV
jgi:hypothetical protein